MTPPEASAAERAFEARPLVDPRRPAPAPDRPRHLHAVPGRPAPGRRPPYLLFIGAMLTSIVLIGLVSINVLVGQSGVGQSSLQKSIDAKQQEADMLQVDVLRLSAPSRIHQRAQQLGMVPAPELTYLAPPQRPVARPSSATVHPSAAPSTRRGAQ